MNIIKKYWKTILVSAIILFLTMRPLPIKLTRYSVFLMIPHFDKVVHFGMFMAQALAIASESVFRKGETYMKFPTVKSMLYIVAIPSVYGAMIEVLQQTCTKDRTGDVCDWIADCMGAMTAMLMSYIYYKKKLSNE